MQFKLMSVEDCHSIVEFETINKTYFEQSVPPRPDGYFAAESLRKIIEPIIEEQNHGECYLYLVYKDNKIVARANLVDIKNQTAELGYRICQSQTGKGLATKVVAELFEIAKTNHQLTRINAHTTLDNPASARVLEKNGFKHLKIVKNAATLNGKNLDFTYYTKDI
ncbi:MAG: GNAT family N-acetyltransferase [Hyphomicrobiales bacterium]